MSNRFSMIARNKSGSSMLMVLVVIVAVAVLGLVAWKTLSLAVSIALVGFACFHIWRLGKKRAAENEDSAKKSAFQVMLDADSDRPENEKRLFKHDGSEGDKTIAFGIIFVMGITLWLLSVLEFIVLIGFAATGNYQIMPVSIVGFLVVSIYGYSLVRWLGGILAIKSKMLLPASEVRQDKFWRKKLLNLLLLTYIVCILLIRFGVIS